MEEVRRLRCEADNYRAELEQLRTKDKERERRILTEHSLASATLQGKLSQANSEVTRKQTEVGSETFSNSICFACIIIFGLLFYSLNALLQTMKSYGLRYFYIYCGKTRYINFLLNIE